MSQESIVSIDKFLGLHIDTTGGLTLQPGELSECKNCRITENYKIRKREGYTQKFAAGSGGNIQGMWYGKLGSSYHFIFARDGHVYKGNLSTFATTDLGAITNARTFFFAFNDKLYIQNGTEYKYWTGTGTMSTVDGHIPKVAIATPPTGGGTPYEGINLLIGKKHQTFKGNGSATVYQLAETSISSVDSVYVDGVLKTVTTHYTVNTTNGTVTFVTAPADYTDLSTDNVDIYWTKGSGTRATVTANKQSILFGGASDSRVFMYGADNKIIYSDLADGVPSAEYFPEDNYLLIGSDEYDVTGLSKQYDRLIVHKEVDSYYCVYEVNATTGAGFPTYPLNDSIGNIAFGECQSVLNNPFAVTNNGIYQFVATNVRDEKNAVFASERVQVGLDSLDLSTAVTFDWERKYEYWVCVGKDCYIYNYKNDTWYYFNLADTPSHFLEINGVCYMGTSTGKIMMFDDDNKTDNGTAVSARWEVGFLDFGANYLRKFLTFGWVGLQPEGRSYCKLNWDSDNSSSATDYEIEYNLMDFSNVNFADFSFDTNYNPQPFRLKFKIKKFTYMRIIGENESLTEGMTILNLTLPALVGGMSK